MAKKKVARPKKGAREPFVYAAMSPVKPSRDLQQLLQWVKFYLMPPEYYCIEIKNGQIQPPNWFRSASRGRWKFAPDWVCWVNKDSYAHSVIFVGTKWPFTGNPPKKIVNVPAGGPSAWMQISPSSGNAGESVRYDYFVDKAPPPDGPAIISAD